MRRFLFIAATAALAIPAVAQDYPTRPVRVVVSQSAGASIDIQARLVAQKLTEVWKQQVIVDNRPGANGIIGMQEVARAKPDGYTFGTAAPTAMTSNQFVYKNLPYKPAEDYVPVTQISSLTFALVTRPTLEAKSTVELVGLAKRKPDELTYSSPGIGNLAHLAAQLFVTEAGIKVRHIPAKGDAGALSDLVSGETDFMISTLPSMLPHIQSGKLKLLAVTGRSRSSVFPDVPTIVEAGYPEVVIEGWVGVIAPARTPAEIVRKVQQDIARQLQNPDIRQALAKQGSNAVGSTPEEFAEFIKTEAKKWERVVRVSGIQAN